MKTREFDEVLDIVYPVWREAFNIATKTPIGSALIGPRTPVYIIDIKDCLGYNVGLDVYWLPIRIHDDHRAAWIGVNGEGVVLCGRGAP